VNLGKIITDALCREKKNQRWLAEQMGKSEGTISAWIHNNKKPYFDDVIKLSTLLDLVPDLFPGYIRVAPEQDSPDFPESRKGDKGDNQERRGDDMPDYELREKTSVIEDRVAKLEREQNEQGKKIDEILELMKRMGK